MIFYINAQFPSGTVKLFKTFRHWDSGYRNNSTHKSNSCCRIMQTNNSSGTDFTANPEVKISVLSKKYGK